MEDLCIECGQNRDDKKHGRYCIKCYNRRRAQGLRGTKSGTPPTPLNENGEKQCRVCETWKKAECFRHWRNQCTECEQKLKKEYSDKNREQINQIRRSYRTEYEKKFREKRPESKIIANYRIRIWQIVKRQKSRSSQQLICCDRQAFIDWLSFNFKDGESFDNYGKLWHMDHIIPCNAFDISDDEQVRQCFHWSNLAPLESSANMSKNDKICVDTIRFYRERAREFIKLDKNKDKGLTLLELTVPNLDSDIRAA